MSTLNEFIHGSWFPKPYEMEYKKAEHIGTMSKKKKKTFKNLSKPINVFSSLLTSGCGAGDRRRLEQVFPDLQILELS